MTTGDGSRELLSNGQTRRWRDWLGLAAVTLAGLALIAALRTVEGVCADSSPASWTCAPDARQWTASLASLLLVAIAILAAVVVRLPAFAGRRRCVRRIAIGVVVAIALAGAAATLDVGGFTLPPRFG